MITTVLFAMGGTLEDIFVDEASEKEAMRRLREMLSSYGLDPGMDDDAFKARVDAGWVRYGEYRDARDVELKPIRSWRISAFPGKHWSPTARRSPICGK